MTVLRLLPWSVGDGADNMARDEALLASAVEEGVASLRFYGWSAATLSLGYFQPHAPARDVPALAALDWVRRPTGGLALVHHHEITYALALPAGMASRQPGGSWLVAVHEAVRDAFQKLGVGSRLCEASQARGEVLCFLHHVPGDAIVGEDKVVGSAQRKSRGALLQHGSILLRRSPHAPELPGIAELTGLDVSVEEMNADLLAALGRRFGWDFVSGVWTQDESGLREQLRESRYRAAAWNERR